MRSQYIRRWELWEKQFIKDNYKNMSDKEMAIRLNRTEQAILHQRMVELKLRDTKMNGHKGEKTDCIICKKIFTKRNPNQKCCSLECSKEKMRHYHKEYINKPEYKNKSKIYRKKYENSERYKKIIKPRVKLRMKQYKKLLKYKNKCKEYSKRPEIMAKRRKQVKIYANTSHGKEKRKQYRNSEHGKNILRMHTRHRRARKNNVIHKFTKEEWTIKLSKTKGICPGCRKFFGINNLTMDHIYPLSKANEDFNRTGIKIIYTIYDVQPLCQSCNSSKNNHIIMKGGDLN